MINDEYMNKVVDATVGWIKARVSAAGAKTCVVGVSGGVDSAVVAALCKKAFADTVGVIMPCHSSESSTSRGREVCEKFGLRKFEIDLASAFSSIEGQFMGQAVPSNVKYDPSKTDRGALRSCLRAPTLDYASKLVNGLIVGTGNRDEDGLVRYFQKRGDGAVDISPIADLHKSEIFQLAKFLETPDSVLNAKPTADLWGPESDQTDEAELGISYDDIEWVDKENNNYGILNGREEHMTIDELAFRYTPKELFVIEKVRHLERTSRHKAIPPPVFNIRWLLGDAFDD